MFKRIACIRIGGGEIARDAAEETPVAIFVNGRHLTTVILSPGGFQDFITGYLYTEEIIKSPDEIESVGSRRIDQCPHKESPSEGAP